MTKYTIIFFICIGLGAMWLVNSLTQQANSKLVDYNCTTSYINAHDFTNKIMQTFEKEEKGDWRDLSKM